MPATRADADHVRRAFDVFNLRFDALRGEPLAAYHAEFFVPGSVIDNADGFPMPATYEGFAGYRQWFDDSYGPYRDVQWAVESVEPVGDRVVAIARSGGRAQGDDTWLEVKLALVYALEDGRIARIDVFLSEEAALRHVNGL